MKSLDEIHINCREIINRELLKEPNGRSTACDMYDAMTDGDKDCENCIGENFNQLIQRISKEWFEQYKPSGEIDYYFYNYCLLLYLFIERVDFVFAVINKDGKSKLFNDFKFNNFKCFTKINKWANFIKHPKEFLFTHWPVFYFEGEPIEKKENDIIIDTEFIFEHYSCETKPSPIILANKTNVFVEIPDLEKLTAAFCNELNVFFKFICENKVVSDFLKEKSTISDYYYEEDSRN